jgi:hypothetical protein
MAATFSSSKANTPYDPTASQATGGASTGINVAAQSVGAPGGTQMRIGGEAFSLSVNIPTVPTEAKAEAAPAV